MSKNITARIAATVLAAASLATVAGTASASTPTHADTSAMRAANAQCAPVTDDVSFEDCVLGDFMLNRNRYVDYNMYTYNGHGQIVLTAHSKAVPAHKVTAPTKADRKAMKAANAQCAWISDETTFEDCTIGEFNLSRERFVGADDFTYDGHGHIVLLAHSVKVS